MTDALRVFSYGGGIQSFAVLLMQTRGELPTPFDVFVFANVGDDSEYAGTLDHVRTVAMPLAAQHGLRFEVVQKERRTGEPVTLLQNLQADNRTVDFPAYMAGGAPGNRSCTIHYKVKVVHKWIKAQRAQRVALGIGFSLDEAYRVGKKPVGWHDKPGYSLRYVYPLIETPLTRMQCQAYISASGQPVPPKSACWFCPFTSRSQWIERRRNEPELFQRAVELEQSINAKRDRLGRDHVYIHPSCTPLNQAVAEQATLFDLFMDNDTQCETGYCGL